MAKHSDLVTTNIHIPYAFSYANAGARTGAVGMVAADVGKFARQTDDNSIWILTATTPTWVAVGGGGGNVATDAIWDALGDLAAGTGPNTAAILTAGANGEVLTADDGEATGLIWAPAGGGSTDILMVQIFT